MGVARMAGFGEDHRGFGGNDWQQISDIGFDMRFLCNLHSTSTFCLMHGDLTSIHQHKGLLLLPTAKFLCSNVIYHSNRGWRRQYLELLI